MSEKILWRTKTAFGSPGGRSALRLKNICDSLMETRELIAKIIAEHSKKTVGEILELTASDAWFSAKEAVEFGLADSILKYAKRRDGYIIQPSPNRKHKSKQGARQIAENAQQNR